MTRLHDRLLSLVLVLALAAPTLSSCAKPAADGQGNGSVQNQTAAPADPAQSGAGDVTAEPETERLYYDTKGADYGGSSFGIWNFDNVTVTGWIGIPCDLFVDELNGDVLNDAVYARNLEIENKLNIGIEGTNVAENFAGSIQKMTAAGDVGVDLIFPLQIEVQALINDHTVNDVQAVESIDFSEPWWNHNCNDTLTMKGKLFTVASDASYFDKLSTIVVFFNQQLVTDYGIGDLYAAVEEGGWTFERMLELGEKVTEDVDGNGLYDQNDAVGISCQNDAPYYFLNGFGTAICLPDEEGNVRLNLGDERTMDSLQAIYALMGDPMRYFNRQTFGLTLNEAINIFRENRSLFMIRPLQSLFVMREMEADFGIIPLPKYDAEQDGYHSAVNPYSGTICLIPRTAEDVERSGVVLSALACESHYTVMGSLYETVLGEKLVRDRDSAVMLDYVFDGTVFDSGVICDFGGIRGTLLSQSGTDVASMLARVTKVVDKTLKMFNRQLEEAD